MISAGLLMHHHCSLQRCGLGVSTPHPVPWPGPQKITHGGKICLPSPALSWSRRGETRDTLDCPASPETLQQSPSFPMFDRDSPERRFLFLRSESAAFNLKDQFSISLSMLPRPSWPHCMVICCPQHLPVPEPWPCPWAKLTATMPCCTGKVESTHSTHGKGHMFSYNIHVGNTCNPFTLFTVLLSIHRRLWSSYLLSAPIIKHIYAVRQ